MRAGYSVTVSKNGEVILTIEREMLSGAELSREDEEAIREAAEHLLAFVGPADGAQWEPPAEVPKMKVASTMNDWNMRLPDAQRVWWTGRFWSADRAEAKRLTPEQAAEMQARWSGSRGQLLIEDIP
jgi:hypothetical protein